MIQKQEKKIPQNNNNKNPKVNLATQLKYDLRSQINISSKKIHKGPTGL